jgi:predicted AAA+ superfamily ATPase
MDDLSFEDFEIEYKYLKAVIEGGLEKKPDNILIYATSNRRHLIKQTWKDRQSEDEVNINDAMQEKLSLSSRFGISILFVHPDKFEYLRIIDGLAAQYDVSMDEDILHEQALIWEVRHGGYSGRTAQQFIHTLVGK